MLGSIKKFFMLLLVAFCSLQGISGISFDKSAEQAYRRFITTHKDFISGEKTPSPSALTQFCYFVTFANSKRAFVSRYVNGRPIFDTSFRLIRDVFNFGIIVDEEEVVEPNGKYYYKVLLTLPHLGAVSDYESDKYGSLKFSTFFVGQNENKSFSVQEVIWVANESHQRGEIINLIKELQFAGSPHFLSLNTMLKTFRSFPVATNDAFESVDSKLFTLYDSKRSGFIFNTSAEREIEYLSPGAYSHSNIPLTYSLQNRISSYSTSPASKKYMLIFTGIVGVTTKEHGVATPGHLAVLKDSKGNLFVIMPDQYLNCAKHLPSEGGQVKKLHFSVAKNMVTVDGITIPTLTLAHPSESGSQRRTSSSAPTSSSELKALKKEFKAYKSSGRLAINLLVGLLNLSLYRMVA